MNQNFENSSAPNTEKFEPYIDKRNPEPLLDEQKSVEQKSSEYAELQNEMVGLGIDKSSVLAAMQELKGEGSAESKTKAMLETLLLGFGEKMFDPNFDPSKEMYNIGKIISGSDFIAQDIKDSFINEIMTEFDKEAQSQDKQAVLEKLTKFDKLEDFNEQLKINEKMGRGYNSLVEEMSKTYSRLEISKSITELQNVLKNSVDGKSFLIGISDDEVLESDVSKELGKKFAQLEDAELFFSNVKDKQELYDFLGSKNAMSSEVQSTSTDNSDRPSWMLG
jgi:hypothetical protein